MTKTVEDAATFHIAVVCRRRGTSYTCIRVGVGSKFTSFIPLETLTLSKTDNREFHDEWEEYTEYPVRRAAELYLKAPHRQIDSKTKAQLAAIIVDPTTVYEIEPQPPKKEPTMAKIATAAAKKAPAAKKAVEKTAPAATKAPVKTAATKAPAKTPVAKADAAKVGATKAPDTTKYKVIAPDAPRRGETADYVAQAVKMKTFTRSALFDAMVAQGKDPAKAKIKIADLVYFKVVEAA